MQFHMNSTATRSIARRALCGALTFALIACARHSASEMNAPQNRPARSTPAPKQSSSAMRAYIDPKTGELRDPTPEEVAAEAATEAQKKKQAADANVQSEEPASRERRTPSGAIEIPLDPSADRPLQACVNARGEIKMDHDCDPSRTQP